MTVADASMVALLIEDDERLARFTSEYLEEHGVRVTCAKDGEAGLEEALRTTYDVVILDLMLPRRDGFDVCRALRERSDVPLIVVTARREEADRVLGLELGADDYMTKPFSPRELLARMRSIVRRARGLVTSQGATIRVGGLVLFLKSLRVTLDGREVPLTAY